MGVSCGRNADTPHSVLECVAQADESQRTKRKPQNLIKMTKEQITVAPERERNEIIQDVIDRLIYLPDDKLQEYKHYLDVLVSVYPIDMRIEDGIRIYHVKKSK